MIGEPELITLKVHVALLAGEIEEVHPLVADTPDKAHPIIAEPDVAFAVKVTEVADAFVYTVKHLLLISPQLIAESLDVTTPVPVFALSNPTDIGWPV